MGGLTQWLAQLRLDSIWQTLVVVLASLFCITVHETCHGLAAYWMGDDTAKRMGRLTLNPLKHVDLVGLIMMALVHFGWAKPVPINMRRFRNPKAGMALTALAGPISNVLLALVALLLRSVVILVAMGTAHYGTLISYLILFFEYMAVLSAGLAVFNLFPIPPLDGSKVLFALLPDSSYDKLMRYEKYGMLLLVVLLFFNVLDMPLIFLREKLLDGLSWILTPVVRGLTKLLL